MRAPLDGRPAARTGGTRRSMLPRAPPRLTARSGGSAPRRRARAAAGQALGEGDGEERRRHVAGARVVVEGAQEAEAPVVEPAVAALVHDRVAALVQQQGDE